MRNAGRRIVGAFRQNLQISTAALENMEWYGRINQEKF